jgi:hypothetical protein
MYNIISIAMGKQYEMEVQRLLKEYPETIVITNDTRGIETQYAEPLLNGLVTKSKFAHFLAADLPGPIFLCDADLVPVIPDPLQHFQTQHDTDYAYVPYPGTWHYPEAEMTRICKKIPKINSGFMYFKNIHVAKDISVKWHAKYLERNDEYISGKINVNRIGEYDEPSLMYALDKMHYKFECLDKGWNNWDNTDCKTYFKQEHMHGYVSLANAPSIHNFGW